MTERTDITVDWATSPRLIEVADTSAELVIQDLHDTLRSESKQPGEAELDNLDDPFLIDSAGKEDLGGGVTVGITSTLQNGQVAFESRLTPTSTGTITTANGAGTTLIDSGATFQTDGVTRGAVVINFTDQSITEVLSVDSQTQLTTRVLRSGTENDYDISDAYKVWNVIQCDISGGNLVALDDLDASISPVFPTFATQIVRTASSSATLQELQDIQYASFAGAVHYDSGSAFSGTAYPKGTPREPVNNWPDALAILAERGLNAIHLVSLNNTLSATENYDNIQFVGRSKNLTRLTIPAGASVVNCEFDTMEIDGTLDGDSKLVRCLIGVSGLTFVAGFIDQCVLEGSITLGGSEPAFLLDCYSGVPGVATPIIDFGGSGQALAMRNYNGGIELQNKSGADAASLDMASGQVVIADTVNAGTIALRGVGKWTNEDTYAGTATIINELLYGKELRELWKDAGLDPSNAKTVSEVTQGLDYDESVDAINKQVRTSGSTQTITRQP